MGKLIISIDPGAIKAGITYCVFENEEKLDNMSTINDIIDNIRYIKATIIDFGITEKPSPMEPYLAQGIYKSIPGLLKTVKDIQSNYNIKTTDVYIERQMPSNPVQMAVKNILFYIFSMYSIFVIDPVLKNKLSFDNDEESDRNCETYYPVATMSGNIKKRYGGNKKHSIYIARKLYKLLDNVDIDKKHFKLTNKTKITKIMNATADISDSTTQIFGQLLYKKEETITIVKIKKKSTFYKKFSRF